MTQEEIRLRCLQVGFTVRGGADSQLAAVGLIADWVGSDEFKLSCLDTAAGQGMTGEGLIGRAKSILKFCKNEPDKPKPAPRPAPVAKKKTFSRGGNRTR